MIDRQMAFVLAVMNLAREMDEQKMVRRSTSAIILASEISVPKDGNLYGYVLQFIDWLYDGHDKPEWCNA